MPTQDYFAAASTATVIKAPASVTADGSGVGVDISKYNGKLMIITSLVKTAGTNPTMATKFQGSTPGDYVGTITYTGSGTGTITEVDSGPATIEEDITVTFTSATAFSVAGGTTGAIGTGSVGTKFTSNYISFLLTAGSTAFSKDETFVIACTAQAYTDITGATIANPGATATIARTVIDADKCGRYIRPVFDIGGTDNPAYTIGITAYGMVQG